MIPRLRTAPARLAPLDLSSGWNQVLNHVFRGLTQDPVSHAPPAFPAVNMWEEDGALRLEAAIAGYSPEDIKVSVAGDELVLEGESPLEAASEVTGHRRERRLRSFKRSIYLPFPIDDGSVVAGYSNGMLTVDLPRAKAALPRQIKVEARS